MKCIEIKSDGTVEGTVLVVDGKVIGGLESFTFHANGESGLCTLEQKAVIYESQAWGEQLKISKPCDCGRAHLEAEAQQV